LVFAFVASRQTPHHSRYRAVGVAMRQSKIPFGEVLASPYCRTMETARPMAIGRVQPNDAVISLRADRRGSSALIKTRSDASLWIASGKFLPAY